LHAVKYVEASHWYSQYGTGTGNNGAGTVESTSSLVDLVRFSGTKGIGKLKRKKDDKAGKIKIYRRKKISVLL
jgi:hypothetical protein